MYILTLTGYIAFQQKGKKGENHWKYMEGKDIKEDKEENHIQWSHFKKILTF